MLPRFAILALLCWPLVATCAEVRLSFREPFYRGDNSVAANHVANVWSKDAGLAERIGAAVIALPESRTVITSDAIIASLSDQFTNVEWTWLGTRSIRREAPFLRIPENALVDAARTALEQRLNGKFIDVTLRAVGRLSDVLIPAGPVTLIARLDEHVAVRPRMAIRVDVTQNGRSVQSVPVWLAVEAYRELPVFNRQMTRGEIPEPDDLRLQRVDVARLDGEPVVEMPREAVRLRQPVREGDVLVQSMLEPAPLVERGDRVKVHLSGETISLTAWGVAKGEGFPGDTINILIDNADALTLARVTGKGELEIEL